MTMKEKLAVHVQIESENKKKVEQFLRKPFGCNALELATGLHRTITGRWSSREAMEEELFADGFIVTKVWQGETA